LGGRPVANIAASAGLEQATVTANSFILTRYARIRDRNQAVNVYIEGDGRAWLSRHQLSADPSPKLALGLELAARDPAINVAYLARPCQFNDFSQTPCDSAYWSDKRFSEQVIDAMDQALDAIVRQTNQQQVNLIGYSGGAAVAVLLAQRRHDIVSLRTVAGNLDHAYVNQYHHVDAMPQSLNAIDAAESISQLPQMHFIGSRDQVIPKAVATRFVRQQIKPKCTAIIAVAAGHQHNWIEQWPNLLLKPLSCAD
jgi:dienelactone hydrolase